MQSLYTTLGGPQRRFEERRTSKRSRSTLDITNDIAIASRLSVTSELKKTPPPPLQSQYPRCRCLCAGAAPAERSERHTMSNSEGLSLASSRVMPAYEKAKRQVMRRSLSEVDPSDFFCDDVDEDQAATVHAAPVQGLQALANRLGFDYVPPLLPPTVAGSQSSASRPHQGKPART